MKPTALENIYNESKFLAYPYARYALLEALEKLSVKTIYLPAFICRDILSPLKALKIKYYFYEINEQFEPILENIKCDSIIAVNYFGFPQDMKPFFEYKVKYNSVIIEDNAHGLFSRDKEGKLLGTRGDLGLLSIRKTVLLPNGAALLVNNSEYKNINLEGAKIRSTYEDKRFCLTKPLFYNKYAHLSFVLIRRLIDFIKTGEATPTPKSDDELPSNQFLTPVLKEKSLAIDINSEIKRRLELYSKIQKWASYFRIKPIFDLVDNVVPQVFAFIDKDINCRRFGKFLLLRGLYIIPWPYLPQEIIHHCNEFYKNVKTVELLF